MTEVQNFTAGDTVKFTKTLGDYPASGGWALAYTFINSTGKFSASGVANADAFDVTISATTTAALTAGDYYFEGYASKAGERFRVDYGTVTVAQNITTAATFDGRSHARKVLDAIEAVIEGRASTDQQEYTIGNRSLKRTPIADLIVLADKYRAMVNKEDDAAAIAAGRGTKNRILVRF